MNRGRGRRRGGAAGGGKNSAGPSSKAPSKPSSSSNNTNTLQINKSQRGNRGGGGKQSPKLPMVGKSVPNIKTLTTPDSVPTDMVRPVLPPLYPEYVEGVTVDKMDSQINSIVPGLIDFQEYLKSNYSLDNIQVKSDFHPKRYTDTYDDPHLVDPRLQYRLDPMFLPKELFSSNSKSGRRKAEKEVNTDKIFDMLKVKEDEVDWSDEDDIGKRKKIEEIDDDGGKAESLEIKKVAKTLEGEDVEGEVDVDDDEDDDVDDEMDEGNDYQRDYFDNGEDYLSEDDALEDGDVF